MAGRVLVIEDDARSIKLMDLILGSQGYEVVVATNGQDGLRTMRSQAFDLVLLDLMLPEVDGFEVLREVRDDPKLANIPVVITSARARATTREEAADLGVAWYLTKPYRKAELLDVVESLVGRGSESRNAG